MDSRIVIVAYKPLPGKENELKALVRSHHLGLKAEDLVTDRTPIIAGTSNGSIIEIFEWKSIEAIHAAHSNSAVLAMWDEFAQVCTYLPASEIQEFHQIFSDFSPLN
ncbi:MAG: hypothetical protein ABI844_06685 [Saprospiraceae bacterium]